MKMLMVGYRHSCCSMLCPSCNPRHQARGMALPAQNSVAYHVELADTSYWRRQVKCQDACPVHTDARGYVRAIAAGDYRRAYLIARGPNPLASICGRNCGAPCEAACRRGA